MAHGQKTPPQKKQILTIGSGTVEYVLKHSGDQLELGSKHTADITTLYGGSGLNYAMRLLAAGDDAFPILAIGHDEAAQKMQDTLLSACKNRGGSPKVERFIHPADPAAFFDPQIKTSSTVVIAHGMQRTLFTQTLQHGLHFIQFLKKRVDDVLKTLEAYPDAVMIGHLHSDAEDANPYPGENTQFIIDTFKGKSSLFANFGNSQIDLGLDFWKTYLPHINLFQLNLEEAKRFFSNKKEKASLVQVVEHIRSLNLNAVITLDKFGAIGIHKDKKDSIILAWPLIDSTEIVDSTGAGDAFGAGLVSSLCRQGKLDFATFHEAIETARTWSALACKSLGGSSHCPDKTTIEAYQREISGGERRPVEIKDQNYAAEIISLIDIAFSE